MKTDKEYPATHSMETSWFAIDKDGNVAVIDFGDDGPLPDVVEYQQNCISEVIFETMAEDEHSGIPCLHITDEQIDRILAYSKAIKKIPCSHGKYYFFDGIIEIDESYENVIGRFILEMNKKATFCRLSEKRHLYYSTVDFGDFLEVMRHIKNFYEIYVEGEEEMDALPFFYYKQEWLNNPAIKQSTPIRPFTIKQLPKSIIDKAIKIPTRFEDSKYLQFAKYFGFITWGSNYSLHTTDDRQYFPMKDENNVMLLYGTKHEQPIKPSEVKEMLERGEIDWERITHSYYELEKKNGQIGYKSYKGDLVTAGSVWQEMQQVFEQIANAPLAD